MISAAFYVCNAIYETIKKQRELTRKDLVAYYLERNYVSWNLFSEAALFKKISLDVTFVNKSYYHWMQDLLQFARDKNTLLIKDMIRQQQVRSKSQAVYLTINLLEMLIEDGNWGRIAVLVLFIEELAEAVARSSDRAAATSFIEIIKEEINNKALGKWGEKLLIDSDCFILY